ncbi:hypothetical protein [Piscirickettsia litoralis]|uniref:DUF2235 domain-containing protein n=1 Tax=Piscirickettsia litoralis TaxID=1891921 RepID=A0ABX3A471_9GAMM|nr:hypothetical protein [Piscirickettsia litoralis]ODN43419.1 hypothetical protein BGC07_11410 [Piscirickettsia litoralis]
MINICVFFCGTGSHSGSDTNVVTLFNNCTEKYKIIIDGPGMDSYRDEYENAHLLQKAYVSLTGLKGMGSGELGQNNWYSNCKRACDYIIDLIAKNAGNFKLFFFGWSRGAVSAAAATNLLVDMVKKTVIASRTGYLERIEKIHLYLIDPVPGSPLDRTLFFSKFLGNGLKGRGFDYYSVTDQVDCEGIVYYSDSGNIGEVDSRMFNTPGFSALDFSHDSRFNNYYFRANHGQIAGKNLGLANRTNSEFKRVESTSGFLVLLSMARKSMISGVSYSDLFLRNINKLSRESLALYDKLYKEHPSSKRGFISKSPTKVPLNSLVNQGLVNAPDAGMLSLSEAIPELLDIFFNTAGSESSRIQQLASDIKSEFSMYFKGHRLKHKKRAEVIQGQIEFISRNNTGRYKLYIHKLTQIIDSQLETIKKTVRRYDEDKFYKLLTRLKRLIELDSAQR